MSLVLSVAYMIRLLVNNIYTHPIEYTKLLINDIFIQDDISPTYIRKVLSTINTFTKLPKGGKFVLINDIIVPIDVIKYR